MFVIASKFNMIISSVVVRSMQNFWGPSCSITRLYL